MRPLVLVLLLLAPHAGAAIPGATHEVRGSILIDGDEDFLAPASGVRGGSGTADDPYVISGWTIAQERTWGIRLRNTSAHVVVEDVRLLPSVLSYLADCPTMTALGEHCEGTSGVRLENAANVTLRRIEIPTRWIGVYVTGSRDLAIVDVHTYDDLMSGLNGIHVGDSERVLIDGTRTEGYPVEIGLRRVAHARLTGLDIHAPHDPGYVHGVYAEGPMVDLALEDSRLSNASLFMQGSVVGLRVQGVELVDGSIGVGAWANVTNGLVCGNVFRGSGLRSGDTRNVTVVGNTFDGGAYGIFMGPASELRIEDNLVTGFSRRGVWTNAFSGEGGSIVLRGNAIEGNVEGAFLPSNGTDARHNWWGDASGPSGIGSGAGDPLTTLAGRTPIFEPWLTQRPQPTIGCP